MSATTFDSDEQFDAWFFGYSLGYARQALVATLHARARALQREKTLRRFKDRMVEDPEFADRVITSIGSALEAEPFMATMDRLLRSRGGS